MNVTKHIYMLLVVLLLTLVGCRKEPIGGTETDGMVRIGVEMLDMYYAETIVTRSGTFPANEREKTLIEGKGFVFVFKASDGLLQQHASLQKDTEGYYAILEASAVGVTVKGVANVEIPTAIQTKITDKTLVIGDLANIYTAYTTTNDILKNTDTGLLPKSSGTLSLTKIDAATVSGQKLTFDFDYARVDIALPTSSETYPKLAEVYAMDVPELPLSVSKIAKTHTVTPTATDAKSVQGLYLYPNATDNLWNKDAAISLMLEVETSAGVIRYYKILIQHPSGTGFMYDLRHDYRYLVKITSLTSDGYATEQEALDAPHANIDYNITYDDNSTHIVDNGQYYIGASKSDYWANIECYQSNMLYATQSEFTMVANNDLTWKYHSDGTYSVEVAFTLGDGDGGNILPKLSGSVTLPAGASFNTATPLANNWKTTTTEQKYTINLTENFSEGDIIIELGELTQTIKLTVDKGAVTDYTDKEVVEHLTGLPDGYGGVTGLRVANSYIAAPMSTENTIYYIPVKDRIKEFWEEYATTPTSEYNIPDKDWTLNKDYTVEVAWYDGEDIDGLKVKKAVSPETNTTAFQNAIKVVIPKGFEHQNVVVNVRKEGTIIWSWHLWVTDYNPYKTTAFANPQRTTVNESIAIIGGNIHSYDGTVWQNGGEYDNKLIMDRNLGATQSTLSGHGGTTWQKGALFYQFGRKDPFPGVSGKFSDGSAWVVDGEPAPQSFEYVVSRPQTYISGEFWNGQSSLVGLNVWHDKNVEFAATEKVKSIFDPSPLGWRVADISTYSMFSTLNFEIETNVGATYTPASAFFPANSCRLYDPIVLDINRLNRTFIWASGGDYQNKALFFTYNSSSIGVGFGVNTSWGFSVRPIQE